MAPIEPIKRTYEEERVVLENARRALSEVWDNAENPPKGVTYFDWRSGFSINEGEYPNIHVSWGWCWHFYLAFSRRWTWSWFRVRHLARKS